MTLRPQAADRRDWLYAALLLGAAFVYFAPLFAFHQSFHGRDHGELNIPLQAWLHQRLAAGEPLAWMGSVSCGDPMQDGLATPAFYPPQALLLMLFQPLLAYALNAVLHFFWGALGCYLWARQRSASREGALLAGLVGGMGGGMAFCLPWWTVVITLAWLPWAFLGLELLLFQEQRRAAAGALLLGLAMGLAFNGGYPGMVAYALIPLGLRAAQGLWRRRGHRSAMLAGLGGAVLIAGLLTLSPLAGVKRLTAASQRGSALSYEAAAENSLSPAALPLALAPHGLGRIGDDSYLGVSWRFGSFDPQGLVLYLGLAGIILAALGLRHAPRRHAAALLGLGVLLLYALGSFTPAYTYFLKLPVLDHLRAPMKAGAFAGLLLCVPIADGYDHLVQRASRRPGRVLLFLGGALLAGGLLLALAQSVVLQQGLDYIGRKIVSDPIHQKSLAYYGGKLQRWADGACLHLALQGCFALACGWILLQLSRGKGRRWALALALVLFGDLAWNGNLGYAKVSDALYAQAPQSLQWLREHAPAGGEPWRLFTWGRNVQLLTAFPQGRQDGDLAGERVNMELPPGNMAAFFGFDQFNGYSPSQLSRQVQLFGWTRDDRAGVDMGPQTAELLRRLRVLELGGVRYILSAVPLKAPGLLLRRDGQPQIYELLNAKPYAWFARQTAIVSGPAEAVRRLCDRQDPAFQWSAPALLETSAGPWPTDAGTVQWLQRDDSLWELEVEVGPQGGTLVLDRLFYPGLFKATVDAREAMLVPANVGFCAMRLEAGRHHVKVSLDKPLLRHEARLYWAAWALLAALALSLWRPRA